jgi:LysM repeat protein
MIHLSKIQYLIVLIILTFVLAGCELPRDSAAPDVAPVEEMPPTLAPLGADTTTKNDVVVEVATAVPTVISVQPVAVVDSSTGVVTTEEIVTTETQPEVQPLDETIIVSVTPAISNEASEVAVSNESEQATNVETVETTTETPAEEPVVVDATTIDETVSDSANPPVAANPPTSDTYGDYYSYESGATYTVQPGDTLFGIGRRYGVTIETIMLANNLSNDIVWVGQVLVIPESGNSYTPPADYPANDGYAAPTYDNYPESTYEDAPPAFNQAPGRNMPVRGEGYHMVMQGETLYSIARRYGTTAEMLININGIPQPYMIYAGQVLAVPTANGYPQQRQRQPQYQQPQYEQPQYQQPQYEQPQPDTSPVQGVNTHTVVAGETLYSIASRYGTTAEAVALANGLTNPNQLYVGQVLYLP